MIKRGKTHTHNMVTLKAEMENKTHTKWSHLKEKKTYSGV